MSDKMKLEPCPHCRQSRFARVREYPWGNEGEPDLRWGYHVICDASGFEDSANRGCGAAAGWGETREDAVNAWNRRSHPSRDAVIEPPTRREKALKLSAAICGLYEFIDGSGLHIDQDKRLKMRELLIELFGEDRDPIIDAVTKARAAGATVCVFVVDSPAEGDALKAMVEKWREAQRREVWFGNSTTREADA